MELQALPARIGQVRRIISAQLRYWHLDSLIDQAALGVTELLTNVHRHAQPDKLCTVEIELLLDRLTVSVHDHDPRLPVLRDADLTETCGRGLALVAAVSESWGARPHGESGKVVWFTLPAPADEPVEPVEPMAMPTRPAHAPAHRSTPRRRRAEHTPARSAVAG
ncbi:ATPase [Streptomyces ruber]|uniref:ATPase n=2 Tax=Streptomyces TaxID=1883 RepID=A0A918ER99_9ACTN|nr:ATPase [Streptomyces ruber]